jgi:hypothetical protein
MTMQIRGSQAGGALRLSLPCKSSVVIPGSPSARQRTSLVRLNRGLKLNTGQWLLRFSVLRETPTTSILSIPFQKAKMLHRTEQRDVQAWERAFITSSILDLWQ